MATTPDRLTIRAFSITMSRAADGASIAHTDVVAVAADGTLTAGSSEEGNLDDLGTFGKFTSTGELHSVDGYLLASIDGNGLVTVPGSREGTSKLIITDDGTAHAVRHDDVYVNNVIVWNADGSLAGKLVDDAGRWSATSDAPPECRRLASFLLSTMFFLADSPDRKP